MRPSVWLFLVLASLLAVAEPGLGATRPRYGGALRIQLRSAPRSLDPAERQAELRLAALVFEPLARIDENGRPQPALAASWDPDRDRKRWRFRLRSGVKFHDGTPLTAAAVAAEAARAGPSSWRMTASGDTLVVESDSPAPELPLELARPRHWIIRRSEDGRLVGTGPFRAEKWEPGVRAVLAAYDDHWGGRPFLDALEVTFGRAGREQLVDLELGKADLVEVSVEEARRAAQRGIRTWSSAPVELLALVFERGRPAVEDSRVREAIALSIDRAAIHNVLLQKQGEVTGALLPQWLSGYVFLFPAAADLERSRALAAQLRGIPPLSIGFDAADPLARAVAERIAVNAREAGITLRTTGLPGAEKAEARLARVAMAAADAAGALAELAAGLGLQEPSPPAWTPEESYAAERALVDGFRIVPLIHLPQIYGLSPRVKNWAPSRLGAWRLDNVWLQMGTP